METIKPQEFLENIFGYAQEAGRTGRVMLGTINVYDCLGGDNIGFTFIILNEYKGEELIIAYAMFGNRIKDKTDYKIAKLYDREDVLDFLQDRVKEAIGYCNNNDHVEFWSPYMAIEDFELKHVKVMEGTFRYRDFKENKKDELTEAITFLVFENICNCDRFRYAQSAYKDTILFDDEDERLVVSINAEQGDLFTFSVYWEV